jgi:hypothetical protein
VGADRVRAREPVGELALPDHPQAECEADAQEGDRGLDEAADEGVHEAVIPLSEVRYPLIERAHGAAQIEKLAKGR